MTKQRELGFVPLVVRGGQIQKHSALVNKINLCMVFVNLLKEQTRYNRGRSLIVIMPV